MVFRSRKTPSGSLLVQDLLQLVVVLLLVQLFFYYWLSESEDNLGRVQSVVPSALFTGCSAGVDTCSLRGYVLETGAMNLRAEVFVNRSSFLLCLLLVFVLEFASFLEVSFRHYMSTQSTKDESDLVHLTPSINFL